MLYIHGIFIVKEKQKRQIDTDRKQSLAWELYATNV